jgi:O-acetyl-ADP-ribose deacetylase (regulator of RNase III)
MAAVRLVEDGNLFRSEAQTWVNTVNTVGAMGKGVALKFRQRFPDMFEDYRRRCESGDVRLGEPFLYTREESPWILNFPTKAHWRSSSNVYPIIDGLDVLERRAPIWGVESLAVPPLGCGQGGLEWRIVGPLYYDRLSRLAIPVELYAPFHVDHPIFVDERPRLFADPAEIGPGAPRSLVPEDWPALLLTLFDSRSGRSVSRVELERLARIGLGHGLLMGVVERPSTAKREDGGFKRTLRTLMDNGLLRGSGHGPGLGYAPGPTLAFVSPTMDAPRTVGIRETLEDWETAIE